jgi:cellulose synthase/poly-beta-1,6-N-acetylglucosamine synthase-like glycosyltransferase
MFLLHDFKLQNYDCRISTTSELIAKTSTPKTFSEFIHQRIRWAQKTPQLKDTHLRIVSYVGMGIELLYFSFLFTDKFLLCIFLKIALDGLFLIPFLFVIQRKKITPFLPLFSILHPFYFLYISLIMQFKKVDWKNRSLGK